MGLRDRQPAPDEPEPTHGTLWEYKVIHMSERKTEGRVGSNAMEREFNQLGAQRWEMVALFGERAVFKRSR